MTHAYCPVCHRITPLYQEPLTNKSVCGGYLGGDLVCTKCDYIIATVYVVVRVESL